jgi:hypothetical protein
MPERMEPVLRQIDVDMSATGERPLIPVGETCYTLFFESFAVGTTRFEIWINGQWLRVQQGDTVDLGDCTPTVRGVLVRTQPALAGLLSRVTVGGTSGSMIERA